MELNSDFRKLILTPTWLPHAAEYSRGDGHAAPGQDHLPFY